MRINLTQRRKMVVAATHTADKRAKDIGTLVQKAALHAMHGAPVVVPVDKITNLLADMMVDLYVKRYYLGWKERRNDKGLTLSFSALTEKTANQLGLHLPNVHRSFTRNIHPRVVDDATLWEGRINRALQQLSAEQLPTRQATIRFRATLTEMGLSPTNPSLPETLSRTHAMLSYGAAQMQLNKNDPYGLIKAYEYNATMDSRTTPECVDLDGKIFLVDAPELAYITPPNHWNCRSQLIEILDDVTPSEIPASLLASAVDEDFRFNPGDLVES